MNSKESHFLEVIIIDDAHLTGNIRYLRRYVYNLVLLFFSIYYYSVNADVKKVL